MLKAKILELFGTLKILQSFLLVLFLLLTLRYLIFLECQVERDGFPCSCGPSCGNPLGRKVFDETEVNMHYINTMMNVKTLL